MAGFRCAPFGRIRVGVIGLGARGGAAVRRLASVPGVEIVALCDVRADLAKGLSDWLGAEGKGPVRTFAGTDESWKALCDFDGVDVVYNCTPWQLHVKTSLYSLNAGKHTLIEVPAALTIDDCWALVETAENRRLHCMQLENECYCEEELLGLSLVRAGIFGELTHAEGGYVHDLTAYNWNGYWNNWRLRWNEKHTGDQYPTHGLGPLALALDVNCGDSFQHLVSLSSKQAAFESYAREYFPEGDCRRRMKIAMGDMTSTLIQTAGGRSILLQHDVSTPRPRYGRMVFQGSKGFFRADPMEICLFDPNHKGSGHHKALAPDRLKEFVEKYRHPLWKASGDEARRGGGHGGIDYMMDMRWSYCLRNGLPLDMSVYDLAAWCAVCELSERSVRSGSMPQSFPDFTRGAWRTLAPRPLWGSAEEQRSVRLKMVS